MNLPPQGVVKSNDALCSIDLSVVVFSFFLLFLSLQLGSEGRYVDSSCWTSVCVVSSTHCHSSIQRRAGMVQHNDACVNSKSEKLGHLSRGIKGLARKENEDIH